MLVEQWGRSGGGGRMHVVLHQQMLVELSAVGLVVQLKERRVEGKSGGVLLERRGVARGVDGVGRERICGVVVCSQLVLV